MVMLIVGCCTLVAAGEAPAESAVARVVVAGGNTNVLPVDFETLAAYSIKVDWLINPTNSSLDTLKRTGEIPDAIKALHGQRVAVQGYMKPLKQDARGVSEFLLMRNHGLCCQTNVPQINEWVHVRMKGKTLPFAHERQFIVRGELQVGEKLGAGNVVSVYRLTGDEISLVSGGR